MYFSNKKNSIPNFINERANDNERSKSYGFFWDIYYEWEETVVEKIINMINDIDIFSSNEYFAKILIKKNFLNYIIKKKERIDFWLFLYVEYKKMIAKLFL
jgi:hypothetical protein